MKVKSIKGIIPYTDKSINIELQGKSLILTGKNGCGKTQLLETIYQVLLGSIGYQANLDGIQQAIIQTKRNINIHQAKIDRNKSYEKELLHNIDISTDQTQKTSLLSDLNNIKSDTKQQESALESRKNQLEKHQNSLDKLSQFELANEEGRYYKKTKIEFDNIEADESPLVIFFEASRRSNFQPVTHITSKQDEIKNIQNEVRSASQDSGAGSLIERFLASWEVQSALREKKKDVTVSQDLDNWKARFTEALKILLDDNSTEIIFNDETLNYTIQQEGKVGFSFRDLSSGYSAILNVFTELLMQTEVSKFSPNSIPGFVVIDEIDAHLHASLQRKVLPFFTELFPQIQFIVSTHSPFVITSDDNVIVYDLSTQMSLDDEGIDLRFYSADVVIESFFDVSTKSEWLNKKFDELTSSTTDISRTKAIIKELEGAENLLDFESLNYFYEAKRRLHKMHGSQKDV